MIGYKGIHQDNTPANTPKGFYRRARNILMKRLAEATSNEDGFSLDYTFTGMVVVGRKQVPGKGILVFLKEEDYFLEPLPTWYNEIGWYYPSTKTYERILKAVFPLYPENTLKIEVEFTNEGHVIAVWNDKDSMPKILNLDKLPFEVDGDKELVNPEEIRLINLFPSNKPIVISDRYADDDTTGQVIYGTYSFLFSYSVDEEVETVPTQVEGSFKIAKEFKLDGGNSIDYVGKEASNRSISFPISNIDTVYKKLNVYVLQDAEGVKRAFLVRRLLISGATETIEYDGTFVEEVSYDEVAVPSIIFDSANAMTLMNGAVVFGGIKKTVDVNYQKYANSILVKWALANDTFYDGVSTVPHKENLYNAPLHSETFKKGAINYHGLVGSFAPESTYQFFIQILFDSGATSIPFNLPGMNWVDSELLALLDFSANLPIPQTIGDPRPATDYTGILQRHCYDYSVSDTGTAEGYMGYSKNENEVYPDTEDFDIWDASGTTGRTLRNLPVRHHKMPGIKRITDKAIALGILPSSPDAMSTADGGDYSLFGRVNLGITLKNIPVTQELIDKGAVGFRILYTERQYKDMDIVAFIPALDFNFTAVTPPGSAPGAGPTTTLVGYDFGLMLKKPSLRVFTKTEFYADAATDSIQTLPTAPGVSGFATVAYAPEDIQLSDVDNTGREAKFYFRGAQPFGGANSGLVPSDGTTPRYLMSDTYRYGSFETTGSSYTVDLATQVYKIGNQIPMLSMRQPLNSHYVGLFSPKKLIDCSVVIPITSGVPTYILSSRMFGGDFVRTENAFRFAHGRQAASRSLRHKVTFPGDAGVPGFTLVHYLGDLSYPTYGRLAAEFRYEKSPLAWQTPGLLVWRGTEANNYSYSPSFELLNKAKTPIVVDPSFKEDSVQPFTIVQSQQRGQRDSVINWRRYLAADFYVMPRKRGKIVNLQGADDKIIIHMERGIFRTRGLITLPTSSSEAAVGTGKLFEFAPQEIFSLGEGYGGTQHLSSCYAFKLGYFFIDELTGKAFLIGDSIKEISSNGMRNFFMENMRLKWAEQMRRLGWEYDERLLDSPLHPFGVGYLVGFDEQNNRLIVSKKDFKVDETIEFLEEFTAPEPIPVEDTPPDVEPETIDTGILEDEIPSEDLPPEEE